MLLQSRHLTAAPLLSISIPAACERAEVEFARSLVRRDITAKYELTRVRIIARLVLIVHHVTNSLQYYECLPPPTQLLENAIAASGIVPWRLDYARRQLEQGSRDSSVCQLAPR